MPHQVNRFALAVLLTLIPVAGTWALEPNRSEDQNELPDVQPHEVQNTWVEVDGQRYGATPSELGHIGGGEGYQQGLTGGDFIATNVDELLTALAQAEAGQVVFLPGDVLIDCTIRVLTEPGFQLKVPQGVTLASDRGQNGSAGAMIFSDAIGMSQLIMVEGADVRITGLRIKGPDTRYRNEELARLYEIDPKQYFSVSRSIGIRNNGHTNLTIDNCELSGWAWAAVMLRDGATLHAHHNYIHHNARRGLGYGISHYESTSLIEYNLFDYNRHAIAGSGYPSEGYEARHNVVLEHIGSWGGHSFDMHGKKIDGNVVAGGWLKIHHNKFYTVGDEAIDIRGVPAESADVHHNWFFHDTPGRHVVKTEGNTHVHDNVYGQTPQIKDESSAY